MANDASRLRAAMLIRQGRFVPPALRKQLAAGGTISRTGTVGEVIKGALLNPVDDAWWAITHPKQRLLGQGRAAGGQMAVPWVAGRVWYHGSPRAFTEYRPSMADPGGMYGPAQYITDSARRASDYAMERGQLEGANVTQYAFAPNRVFDIAGRASKQDVKRLTKGLGREAQAQGQRLWNADLKLLSKGWVGQPRDTIYSTLADRFGKPFANAAIKRAGYDAISFMEGDAGGVQRAAMAVLNRRRLVRGGIPDSKK